MKYVDHRFSQRTVKLLILLTVLLSLLNDIPHMNSLPYILSEIGVVPQIFRPSYDSGVYFVGEFTENCLTLRVTV